MSKKKTLETGKPKKEIAEKEEKKQYDEDGFGGLPDRDLKKSLGCGG